MTQTKKPNGTLYVGSIEVSKVKPEFVRGVDRSGNPYPNGAKYLPISIWVNDEPDQYGNYIQITIWNNEEKIYISKNIKKYIPNATNNYPQQTQQQQQPPQQPQQKWNAPGTHDSDLPF